MQGTHSAHTREQNWEDVGNLTVGIHPSLNDLMLGLNTAIEAIGEMEKLRHRGQGERGR